MMDADLRYAYPRLADSHALLILKDVEERAKCEPGTITGLVAFEHPAASPVATGATVAPLNQLARLRERVVGAIGGWLGEPVPARDTIQFDNLLGKALYEHAAILPADASNRLTWNFLSAVVFPDVVWCRFPALHEDRFLGKPRNALRRVWFRRELLGDLLDLPYPLGEDELVGLLERSALARNHALVRVLAKKVSEYRGTQGRSEYARALYKHMTHVTGPLMLDLHEEAALRDYVDAVAAHRPWPHDQGLAADGEESDWTDRSAGDMQGTTGLAKDSGDIVRRLHDDMERLVVEVFRETGFTASKTAAMIHELGGLEAARKIAGSAAPSESFGVLRQSGRLDLTVESLVLHPEYSGLFSGPLLVIAAAKLEDARR